MEEKYGMVKKKCRVGSAGEDSRVTIKKMGEGMGKQNRLLFSLKRSNENRLF